MPIMGWIAIGVALSGMLFTVCWYLVQRRVSRLDLLEQAVFGDTGVRERMHKFITRENFEAFKGSVNVQLAGLRDEGQGREERILEAVRNQTLVLGSDIRECRNYLNDQNKRIDQIFNGMAGGR